MRTAIPQQCTQAFKAMAVTYPNIVPFTKGTEFPRIVRHLDVVLSVEEHTAGKPCGWLLAEHKERVREGDNGSEFRYFLYEDLVEAIADFQAKPQPKDWP